MVSWQATGGMFAKSNLLHEQGAHMTDSAGRTDVVFLPPLPVWQSCLQHWLSCQHE